MPQLAPQKLFPHHHEAPIPAHIKGLIFDCDGTLVDTMPMHYQAWLKTLAPLGIPFDEDRFYSFAGMPTQKIIEILCTEQGIHADAAQLAHEKELLYIAAIPGVAAIHDVVNIARREHGHRQLAVASGGWAHIVRQSLTAIGILELFPVIVGADNVVHGKPHPDVFLEAARQMNLTPDQCIVYEDGELGFQAAHAAKMQVIDVRPWYLPRK